jgi:hypothetical protein
VNWSEKELDLFKSKRQRGTAVPAPPDEEFRLHCIVADVLKRWCNPSWRYTHLPMGEHRSKATSGRLKRMGVVPGWPDFQFFHCRGTVCFLELKREGGKPTQEQGLLGHFLENAGHKYLCTDTFDAALKYLKECGIVPARIGSWGANINTSLKDADPWSGATPETSAIE